MQFLMIEVKFKIVDALTISQNVQHEIHFPFQT